jgi:tetratricopeptide (TPR) repeat protein
VPRHLTLRQERAFGASALLLILFGAGSGFGQDASLEELFNQAQAASRQNNYAQAEKLYRQILAADPEILPARVNLGLACYWQHETREALTEFKRALLANPLEFSALLFSGLAYIELTDYDRAQAMLEKARQVKDNDPLLFWALGSLAMMHNDARAAVPQLERCVSLAPDNVRCVWLLGTAYAILAYHEHAKPPTGVEYAARAESALRWMEEREPDTALVHVFKGDVLAARQATAEALTQYQKAQEIDPQWPDIHLLIGSLLGLEGRWDEALAELKRQLQLHPDDTRAMVEMGSVYCRAARYSEAVPFLQRALTRDSSNYEANYRLGQAYLSLSKYSLAIPLLEHATQAKPDKSSPYYLLYRAYRTMQQPEKAAEALKQFKRLKALGS